jgi:hypothetical protein
VGKKDPTKLLLTWHVLTDDRSDIGWIHPEFHPNTGLWHQSSTPRISCTSSENSAIWGTSQVLETRCASTARRMVFDDSTRQHRHIEFRSFGRTTPHIKLKIASRVPALACHRPTCYRCFLWPLSRSLSTKRSSMN